MFGGFEAVVAPSSSCVGTLREEFGFGHVYELSELLVGRLGVEDVGAVFEESVCYHPTCHSLRVTRVGDAPVRLLAERAAGWSCGSCRGRRSAAGSAGRSR